MTAKMDEDDALANPSDTDSMMASALLEIRSDSRQKTQPEGIEGNQSGCVSSEANATATAASPVASPASSTANAASAVPSNASIPAVSAVPLQAQAANVANTPHRINPAMAVSQQQALQPFTSQQIAVLQAAATAGAASFAAAASQQIPIMRMLSDRMHQLPQPIQPSPVQQPVSHVPSAPMSGTHDWKNPGKILLPANIGDEKAQSDALSEDSNIRREQVEAALRSKPQRGRKRCDLSDQERLELTRTRNREHAKSTRIRKKARYQELLDREKQLEELEAAEELRLRRRQGLVDFLGVREQMLTAALMSDRSTSTRSDSTEKATNTDTTSYQRIEDLICSPNDFSFDNGEATSDGLSGLDHMKKFDESLLSRILGRCGESTIPLLRFRVVTDSAESVAISENDAAFVEVELIVSGHENVSLLRFIVHARFVKKSSRIASISWVTVKDFLDDRIVERLDAQTSYPSVVSLDKSNLQEKDNPEKERYRVTKGRHQDDDTAEPGLSF